MRCLVRYREESKESLLGYGQIYQDLDRMEKEAYNRGRRFFDKQFEYRNQAHLVRAFLESENVCREFDKLQTILSEVPNECHPAFFSAGE